MTNESKDAKLSRKERAREARHAAYLRAKEWRATDPRHLAMEETAKQRRHEAYQEAKDRRKEAAAEFKRKRKEQKQEKRAAKRTAADEQLMRMVEPATRPGPTSPGAK